jgi:hypothetical protein
MDHYLHSVEWGEGRFGGIYYDHDWTIGCPLLFLIVMFPLLRLHYKRPLLAYIASVIIMVFLLNWLMSLGRVFDKGVNLYC